jgi:hypothetical protein
MGKIRSIENKMEDEHFFWKPLSLSEAQMLLSNLPIPWWVAGGVAIDLFVGYETREHGDFDIGIFRKDQLILQEYLKEWDLHKTNQPGLKPWPKGEYLTVGVNQVWCRRTQASPWEMEVMFMEIEDQRWYYRRVPTVNGPISDLCRKTQAGIQYLAPEIQLLYKASKAPKEKDDKDFNIVLPLLGGEEKIWLKSALKKQFPEGHVWMERLRH